MVERARENPLLAEEYLARETIGGGRGRDRAARGGRRARVMLRPAALVLVALIAGGCLDGDAGSSATGATGASPAAFRAEAAGRVR